MDIRWSQPTRRAIMAAPLALTFAPAVARTPEPRLPDTEVTLFNDMRAWLINPTRRGVGAWIADRG
jgi:hypothetical protein